MPSQRHGRAAARSKQRQDERGEGTLFHRKMYKFTKLILAQPDGRMHLRNNTFP